MMHIIVSKANFLNVKGPEVLTERYILKCCTLDTQCGRALLYVTQQNGHIAVVTN